MKKIILISLLLSMCVVGYSQLQNQNNATGAYEWRGAETGNILWESRDVLNGMAFDNPPVFGKPYFKLNQRFVYFDSLKYRFTEVPNNFAIIDDDGRFKSVNKGSTLSWYGITDAYPLSGNPSSFIDQAGARTAFTLTTTGNGAATYNNSTGALNIPTPAATKRQETYSGTTSTVSSVVGTYTVTFSTAFSATPNIQANIIGATDSQNIRITAISTTGFTVVVRNRTDVVGLLPSWAGVNGANVDVVITEK